MSQFNRVRVAIASGGIYALTLGAADTDCNSMASYAGTGGIPYLLTWSGGYEVGTGSLSGDGTTFIRWQIFENNLDSTTNQDIPVGALISVLPVAHLGISTGVNSGFAPIKPPNASTFADALAIGPNATGAGSNSVTAGLHSSGGADSVAIGAHANTAENGVAIGARAGTSGSYSVAVGADAAANSQFSLALGALAEASRGGEIVLNAPPNQQHFHNFHLTTTNATATVAHPDNGGASDHVVPVGDIWYVEANVLAVQFNSSTTLATKAKVINLSALCGPTGPLVTVATPVVVYNFGTFAATATIGVTASGQVRVTVTGVAATEIEWRISLNIRKIICNYA